jgi:hypothetical protein
MFHVPLSKTQSRKQYYAFEKTKATAITSPSLSQSLSLLFFLPVV